MLLTADHIILHIPTWTEFDGRWKRNQMVDGCNQHTVLSQYQVIKVTSEQQESIDQ